MGSAVLPGASATKTVAVGVSETFVPIHQSARPHIPDDSNFRGHLRWNLGKET